jgi:transcriptional regulator with XRE-family HTH domain
MPVISIYEDAPNQPDKLQVARFYVELGHNIKEARKRAGLRQMDVALACGILRSSLALIEGGRQTLAVHQLATIATSCNVTIEALVPNLLEV